MALMINKVEECKVVNKEIDGKDLKEMIDAKEVFKGVNPEVNKDKIGNGYTSKFQMEQKNNDRGITH